MDEHIVTNYANAKWSVLLVQSCRLGRANGVVRFFRLIQCPFFFSSACPSQPHFHCGPSQLPFFFYESDEESWIAATAMTLPRDNSPSIRKFHT